MNVSIIKECPHCSKRLATALDHWSECFLNGSVSDDFADEISEILSKKAQNLRYLHSQHRKE